MHYINELRLSTGLSQKEFANKFDIPLSTLRKWEQGESRPANYVVKLIEASLPCFKKQYLRYISEDKNVYYLDKENKRVGDSLGNWISFDEDIDNVIENNIPLYIDKLFKQYYQIINSFNEDLFYDKKNKIRWK